MRIRIGAIGKLKKGAEKQLVADYISRAKKMGRQLGISDVSEFELNESQNQTVSGRKADEAENLLSRLDAQSVIIALDEYGQNLSSRKFAKILSGLKDGGQGEAVLLIGGPDGHGDAVLKRARYKIALGAMTWPHRIARILVAEQLYRATTIMANHPYHRD